MTTKPSEAPLDQASIEATFATYEAEKAKRLRTDGADQYLELQNGGSRLSSLDQDMWVDHEALNAQQPSLKDGDGVKIVVVGAGLFGLMAAVNLIKEGIKPSDIRIVEAAGGFGGTWYWNRYPGLMCDIESYGYLPFLEETGYMPKHRFSYGHEIRDYVKLLAEKWHLVDKTVFRTSIQSSEWDEASRRWTVSMTQNRGPNQKPIKMTVRAQFVLVSNSLFAFPKVPKIPGIEEYAGAMTHSARWDYNLSGGSQAEPVLSKLRGKRVGIIGTGITGVQLVPELAKHAKHLYVFQRTPALIDCRGQNATDPQWFQELASKPGWWEQRNEKWYRYIAGYEGAERVTNDGWSDARTLKNHIGGYHEKPVSMEEAAALVQANMAEDLQRTDRIRRYVDSVVKDKKTASSLKAWHPTWCKRPTFHDGYLQAFNLPNVTLVDTDGKGVERMTADAVVAAGKEYPVDFLVLATGFRTMGKNMGDPSTKAAMTIRGTKGTMTEKWMSSGPASLHGYTCNSFPNMFIVKLEQAAACPNFIHVGYVVTRHIAQVIVEASKRVENPERLAIEPTVEHEEAWIGLLMKHAVFLAAGAVCGPNYANFEGQKLSPEVMMKIMRNAPYAKGLLAYKEVLDKWRAEGSMEGLVIRG